MDAAITKDGTLIAMRNSSEQDTAVGSDASTMEVEHQNKSTRRLLRKIDFALIPFLALLYLQVDLTVSEHLMTDCNCLA